MFLEGFRATIEALGRFDAARFLDKPSDFLAILMYHGIEDRPEARDVHTQDIASASCIDEIRFFLHQGYKAVSPGDWLEPGDAAAPKLVVTFDDGNLNTIPLLRRLTEQERIPVVIAVCPQVVESGEPFWYEEVAARIALSESWREQGRRDANGQVLVVDTFLLEHYFGQRRLSAEVLSEVRGLTTDVTADQVAKSNFVHANMIWEHLAGLVATGLCTIASHSMIHEAATHMTPDEFERDARQCRDIIEARLGVECRDYVYPFGSTQVFSDQTEAALQHAGYERSYTTVHRLNRTSERMALGRFTGTGLNISPRYYHYLWRQRHATADGTTVAPL